MTADEAVRYLLSILFHPGAGSFRLERIEALMEQLGHPERAFRVVHVAGTNGKGSTAAMIETGLRAAGFSTGLYTSPHLSRFNERYSLNGLPVDDEGFARAVEEVRAANEALADRGGRRLHPTMFEAITAVAFCVFRNAKVDWAVVEVGLGGRLDATNVVQPEIAVVTPVAFDHEGYLGTNLADIAREKAGIFKPGCRVILSDQQSAAREALEQRATDLRLRFTTASERWRLAASSPDEDGGFSIRLNGPDDRQVNAKLSLLGEHQAANAVTATAAMEALGLSDAQIETALSETVWPGRLEIISRDPDILIDAAHNPAGARTLADYLRRFQSHRKIHLIFGASREKAVEEVAGLLFDLAARVTLTRSQVKRSLRPKTLFEIVDHLHDRIDLVETSEDALARAEPGHLIVIAGSIFLIGEVRGRLLAN